MKNPKLIRNFWIKSRLKKFPIRIYSKISNSLFQEKWTWSCSNFFQSVLELKFTSTLITLIVICIKMELLPTLLSIESSPPINVRLIPSILNLNGSATLLTLIRFFLWRIIYQGVIYPLIWVLLIVLKPQVMLLKEKRR